MKQEWIGLKPYKSSNLLFCQIIFQKSFSTTATRFFQPPTYPTTSEVSQQNQFTVRIQCSTLSKLNNFPLSRKRCAATVKRKSLLKILQSLQFNLFSVQKMILYQIVVRLSKRLSVSFDDIVHLIGEENIVTYVDFDCGITFYTETVTKIRQIKREQNYISRSWETPKCICGNNQPNCSIDEQHSSNTFLIPYNSWDMVPAALTLLNHTNHWYSMSNQYLQSAAHQPRTDSYPVFFHCERWTVKERDCASASRSFEEITYRTGEWTRQLLRLKSSVISGNPEQWMEFRRLW